MSSKAPLVDVGSCFFFLLPSFLLAPLVYQLIQFYPDPPNNIAGFFFWLVNRAPMTVSLSPLPILYVQFNGGGKEGRKQSRLDLVKEGNRILNWQHGNIQK